MSEAESFNAVGKGGVRLRLRPVDVARARGLSAQAVRNYEEQGILPPGERTASGYRVYSQVHVRALHAFAALVAGHGHQVASAIMQAVNLGQVARALALIDESHQQLLGDRETLAAVERALGDLAGATPAGPSRSRPVLVGRLAWQLGVRAATLRAWERAGVLQPRRDPRTGYRVYGPADVRDARLAHQLRRGGYLLRQIAPVLAQIRAAGGVQPLRDVVGEWRERLDRRGRAMLTAAGELGSYIATVEVSTS